MPIRFNVLEESVAVVTHTARVECDFRITRVHHAIGANLIRALGHCGGV